jgi:hypothetical protein
VLDPPRSSESTTTLVADEARPALGAFIRVAAIRTALDLLRERRPAGATAEAMEAWRPGEQGAWT